MAYDTSLPDNQNWVRFLIGDTTSSPILADAEIDAVITEQSATGAALKYFAAADCLEAIGAEWASGAKGITEKQVDELRIRRDAGVTLANAITKRAEALRAQGALKSSTSPYVLKAV